MFVVILAMSACYKVGATAMEKLDDLLSEDTIAVNNFAQSTQSEHGPKLRQSEPKAGSLMKALFDKVDVHIAKQLSRTTVQLVGQHAAHPVWPRKVEIVEYLEIDDVTAMACVSATQWREMPFGLRRLIELKVLVIKFAYGRALDGLMRLTLRVTRHIRKNCKSPEIFQKYSKSII